jgi:hypothetical protein
MSSLRAISTLLHTYCSSSTAAGRGARRLGFAPRLAGGFRAPSKASSVSVLDEAARAAGCVRRRVYTRAASWDSEKSPYETLGTTKLCPRIWDYRCHLRFCSVKFPCRILWILLMIEHQFFSKIWEVVLDFDRSRRLLLWWFCSTGPKLWMPLWDGWSGRTINSETNVFSCTSKSWRGMPKRTP